MEVVSSKPRFTTGRKVSGNFPTGGWVVSQQVAKGNNTMYRTYNVTLRRVGVTTIAVEKE
jgi:hypothetical protein